ncbi:MAG TPA: GNAT family N-acetyltransferase [Vicinamibacterales bacterium]|jgi:GNAT superfamily N-acetyltransferase|nr:GNAT family N-acetyltransferase [Vicinamibacterales bacterium]
MKASGPVPFRVERATEDDVGLILRMIKGLADYEQLSHEVVATESGLRESLFGRRPAAEVIIGYAGQVPVGFAVFFHNFSTFLGRPGMYLEDLFVVPEWRNQGFGRRLLACVATIAVERGCGRMEWSVLDWNEPARRFYRGLGARAMDEWTVFRLTGDALRQVAAEPVKGSARDSPAEPSPG